MDEISRELICTQGTKTEPGEISKVLLRLKAEIDWQFLRPYTREERESFITKLWQFLCFTGSHSNTSVRLSAYQTTGCFLLKLMPYYPDEMRKMLSEMLTGPIAAPETMSSAVIASTFAFMSNFVAFWNLDVFIKENPVFHHFSISDQIFSDHLASIIRNMGRLGMSWLVTLLRALLVKFAALKDRYLLRSIAAVVEHDPETYVTELLIFVREQSHIRSDLPLLSFIFSIVKCNVQELDILDVAGAAVDVLVDIENSRSNEIDSAFQILAMRTCSFSISIEEIDEDHLKIVVLGGHWKKRKEVVIEINRHVSRSCFYLLSLPIKFLAVTKEDGVLQLTSKYHAMAQIVNDPNSSADITEVVVGRFIDGLKGKWNERTSPCIQGLAQCLHTILRNEKHTTAIESALTRCMYARVHSWYHAYDIVRIIEAIPLEYMERELKPHILVDKLFEFTRNKNEKLRSSAEKEIVRIMGDPGSNLSASIIAGRIDYFSTDKLASWLDILTQIMQARNGKDIETLHYVVLAIIEADVPYLTDANLFRKVMCFFSCFDLGFIPRAALDDCLESARAVVFASLYLLTGLQVKNDIADDKKACALEMVERYMSAMNYDMISESIMAYSEFLSPFVSALRFISTLPCEVTESFAGSLFESTFYVFPLDAAVLAQKHWSRCTYLEKVSYLQRVFSTLEYVQDYRPAAIWCELHLELAEYECEELTDCAAALTKIALWAIAHGEVTPVFYVFAVRFADDLSHVRNSLAELSTLHKMAIRSYADTYFLWMEERMNELWHDVQCEIVGETDSLVQSEERDVFVFDAKISKDYISENFMDSDHLSYVIKTQLRYRLYSFTEDQLQRIMTTYCQESDGYGILCAISFAWAKPIPLKICGGVVPKGSISRVLRFMKRIQSPDLDAFVEKIGDCDNENAEIMLRVFDPSRYCANLLNAERLQKADMQAICKLVYRVPYPTGPLLDLIDKAIDSSAGGSVRRMETAIAMTCAILQGRKDVPVAFIPSLLSRLRGCRDQIPPYYLMQCLSTISSLLPVGIELTSTMLRLVQSCVDSSGTLTGHRLFIARCPSHAMDLSMNRLVSSFELEIPSVFCDSCRYLSDVIALGSTEMSSNFLRECMRPMMLTFSRLSRVPGVPAAVGIAIGCTFSAIKSEAHAPYQMEFLKISRPLIPNRDNPAFDAFVVCMLRFLSMINEKTPELMHICQIGDNLMSSPPSFRLFEVWLMLLGRLLDKRRVQSDMLDYLIDRVDAWKNQFDSYDCYRLSDVIFEWEKFVFDRAGLAEVVKVVCIPFIKRTPRFFSFFVAFARFEKWLLRMTPTDKDRRRLSESKHILSLLTKFRAHKVAMIMFENGTSMKTALDLASFECDCQESEAVIALHPEFEAILDN